LENLDFIFDIPIEYGGNLDSSQVQIAKDGLLAFDIKTGMKAA